MIASEGARSNQFMNNAQGVIRLHIFLDTMIYLHCVPIEEIDFCSIFGVNSVNIIVPRVTLKELEKHKNQSSRLRDRARQALSFLVDHIESGSSARNGISIEFSTHIPLASAMESLGLNPAWNDDFLIAAVVEWKERHLSADTVLVTHDSGARLTCRQLGIRTVELAEKYQLVQELDESEKEIQRLRRELQQMQNALPKIVVGFDDRLTSRANFKLKAPEIVDESQIANELSRLRDALPELPAKRRQSGSAESTLSDLTSSLSYISDSFISREEFGRYNRERLAYFEQCEQFMRDRIASENALRRSLRFIVKIFNSGTVPADDVTVRLVFPDGLALCSEADLLPLPQEPQRPAQPRNALQLMQSMGIPKLDHNLSPVYPLELRSSSSFQLRRTNDGYEITDHFSRIKHGFTESLPEITLIFDSIAGSQSFNCDYEVSVANLPKPVQGKLHFVIGLAGVETTS